MNSEWVENEFRDIGIRDERLVKRLIKTGTMSRKSTS